MPRTAVCRNRNSRLEKSYPSTSVVFHSCIKILKLKCKRATCWQILLAKPHAQTWEFLTHTAFCGEKAPHNCSPHSKQREPLWSERLMFGCGSAANRPGSGVQPSLWGTEKAPWPQVGQSSKLGQNLPVPHLLQQNAYAYFLLARDVCIYHPFLNELIYQLHITVILLLSKPISCKSVVSASLIFNFV